MHGWIIIGAAFLYLILLFAVASIGDRKASRWGSKPRPYIYAFSLAVYCTSWTFFGSVGLAANRGLEFLGIYIGPILVFTIGNKFLRHVVRLAKAERITSIADFLAARYGKSTSVATIGTCIAVVGSMPYIALQLKAVSGSVDIRLWHERSTTTTVKILRTGGTAGFVPVGLLYHSADYDDERGPTTTTTRD